MGSAPWASLTWCRQIAGSDRVCSWGVGQSADGTELLGVLDKETEASRAAASQLREKFKLK